MFCYLFPDTSSQLRGRYRATEQAAEDGSGEGGDCAEHRHARLAQEDQARPGLTSASGVLFLSFKLATSVVMFLFLFLLQEKDMKSFKEEMKRETKRLKHDVESKFSKDQRKEALRRRKEEMEIDHAEKVVM